MIGIFMRSKLWIAYMAALLFSASSCVNMFEYSPYDSRYENTLINVSAIEQLLTRQKDDDTLRFGLIADSHNSFDELKTAIALLNKENIRFIICLGDVADHGLAEEYELYKAYVEKSNVPVVTVIGNHDYRSNGKAIYEQMFGQRNFTISIDQYKFVVFDDVVWENGNQLPDFDWLERQYADTLSTKILVTHIPPWDEQLTGDAVLRFNTIVNSSNTILSLHGHEHRPGGKQYNGIRSVVSGCLGDRLYTVVSLDGKKSQLKRVKF